MSLNLPGKSGITTAGTYAAGLTATVTNGDIAAADQMQTNKELFAYFDTTAGDITVSMTDLDALTGIADGDVVTLVKTSSDSNEILFTDGDGVAWDFADIQSERYCFKRLGAGNWILV